MAEPQAPFATPTEIVIATPGATYTSAQTAVAEATGFEKTKMGPAAADGFIQESWWIFHPTVSGPVTIIFGGSVTVTAHDGSFIAYTAPVAGDPTLLVRLAEYSPARTLNVTAGKIYYIQGVTRDATDTLMCAATGVPSGNFGPVVTVQPQGVSVDVGQPATFTSSAVGRPTPTTQWQRHAAVAP